MLVFVSLIYFPLTLTLSVLQFLVPGGGGGAPGWLAGNKPRKPGFLRVLPSRGWLWQIAAPEYLGTHYPSVMQWINSNTFTNIVLYI